MVVAMLIKKRCFPLAVLAVVSAFSLLSGCGGSDGERSEFEFGDRFGVIYQKGRYDDASDFQDQCAEPRVGYDETESTAFVEKMWLRSWSHEEYLWYDEIEDRDPEDFSVTGYFDVLKTYETTNTGRAKDQFHFWADTEEWEKLSESGVSLSYGWDLRIVDREITILRVEPNSPADEKGIARGDKIVSIDGIAIATATGDDIDKLNAALSPRVGMKHVFKTVRPGVIETGDEKDDDKDKGIEMIAVDVTFEPVQLTRVLAAGTRNVGYLYFDAFIATAEARLIDAFNVLKAAEVDDLVIDARYNGGGLLGISSQLAYMIAGKAATEGRIFQTFKYNDKKEDEPLGFIDTSVGYSVDEGEALPSLDLPRVFVLTTADTCSASESLINGLQGIGIEVVIVGDTTCGKPYGFTPRDNCGTTYFTIEFQNQNAMDFGDYADGFYPANKPDGVGAKLKGCYVEDDLSWPLGDVNEAMIAGALKYIETGRCPRLVEPNDTESELQGFGKTTLDGGELKLIHKNPLRSIQWIEAR